MARLCSIDGCEGRYVARGMCKSHYYKAVRAGTLADHDKQGPARSPIAPRFWVKVAKTESCWLWTGTISRDGYGNVRVDGRMAKVHRVSYELANGPIPNGMQVDHICFNRACVNPSHLRLATNKENKEHMRGARSDSRSGVRGVSWYYRTNKWVAQVRHHGVTHVAGYFTDINEAEAAVIELRNKLFTHNLMDRGVA